MNKRDWILWLTFGWPTILQGWFLGCGALLVRRSRDPRVIGPFLVTTKNKGRKRYTTTLGAWVNASPDVTVRTMYHEMEVHGEQYLELNVLGAFISLLSLIGGPSWWDIAWWASSGFLWLGPNYLVAFIRYKSESVGWLDACYYWTSHEQDAYARTQAEFDGWRHKWEKG